MENNNDSLWQRLLISCGVMIIVSIVCISGFAIAASAYLVLGTN